MLPRVGRRLFSTRPTFRLSKSSVISKYDFKQEIITVLGYGSQGKSQSLNMRDQKHDVSLGLRENGKSWNQALNDGWIPNKNLFTIESAVKQATIVHNLLSDTAQIDTWSIVKNNLNHGCGLSFSHGLGIVHLKQTNMIPPANVDVFMIAPKGVGPTVRSHFLNNKWINASWAVHQDSTGNANQRCKGLAKAIGCGHIFETTFEKETFSDLTGERCVLMGLIQGAFKAQYEVLRENGHSAEEAFNETVEEALESLYPMVSEKGMDHLFANCSMVAQRGALDWSPKFEAVLKPVIRDCYNKVKDGSEMERVLEMRNDPNYRDVLNKELDEMKNSELWKTGKKVRDLRSKDKNVKRKYEIDDPIFLL